MKKITKIFEILLYLFFFIFIIINLITIISLKALKQDYPKIFGYTYFEIASNSMYPTLKKGDVVVVKLHNNKFKSGDIITFKDGKLYTTHRIKTIKKDVYVTKGDSNNIYDDPIKSTSVVGKVVFNIKKLGAIINVIKNPITIVIIFLLMISVLFMRKKSI